MTVWQVFTSYCRYEGGSTEAIFSTYEKAREYALERVAQLSRQAEPNHEAYLAQYPEAQRLCDPWSEEDPDYFGDGMSCVVIIKTLVDDPAKIEAEREQLRRDEEYALAARSTGTEGE